VEQGICPIAMLYSLAAAHKRDRCKQGAIIFHGGRAVVNLCPKVRCHGNRGSQKKKSNDTI